MILDDIKKRILEIKSHKGDPEVQHSLEDELHIEFIKYISRHGDNSDREKAREILKVAKWKFSRWYS